jgi:hypothetical protein
MIPQLGSPKAKAWAKRVKLPAARQGAFWHVSVKEKYEYDHSPSSAGLAYDGFNSFVKVA